MSCCQFVTSSCHYVMSCHVITTDQIFFHLHNLLLLSFIHASNTHSCPPLLPSFFRIPLRSSGLILSLLTALPKKHPTLLPTVAIESNLHLDCHHPHVDYRPVPPQGVVGSPHHRQSTVLIIPTQSRRLTGLTWLCHGLPHYHHYHHNHHPRFHHQYPGMQEV